MMEARPETMAVVQDFDFKNTMSYLRKRETANKLDCVLQGGSSLLRITLRFSSKFDSTLDRTATTWMNFTKNFAKKNGKGLRTSYSIFPGKKTPATRNFVAGLRFNQDLDAESEWAKILGAFKRADTMGFRRKGPTIQQRREADERSVGLWEPAEADEETEEEEVNILPPDDMEFYGGDAWAKELLGGMYPPSPLMVMSWTD